MQLACAPLKGSAYQFRNSTKIARDTKDAFGVEATQVDHAFFQEYHQPRHPPRCPLSASCHLTAHQPLQSRFKDTWAESCLLCSGYLDECQLFGPGTTLADPSQQVVAVLGHHRDRMKSRGRVLGQERGEVVMQILGG